MTKRIIIGVLAGLALLGCESETGVRLVVRTDIPVPADLDAVTVTVFAGADATAPFDRQNTFDNLTAADFPLTVGVTPGAVYKTWVLFRVQGILGNDVVVERWVLTEFTSGEIKEVVVELQNACLANLCTDAPGQECVDGACAAAPRPTDWLSACGDTVLDADEDCDDGNTTAGDGCSPTCEIEAAVCGNNVVETGEQCDDGNTDNGDGCSSTCRTEGPECGDLRVDAPGEECDDGNTNSGDGCENDCQFTCDTDTDCADTDQCTADVCATVALGQNCTNDIDEGAACDDGNDCTDGEECDAAGDCLGGTNTCECDPTGADTCEADNGDDDPCNGTLICDDATSACIVDDTTILAVDDPCDNGVFCDGVDTCQGDPIACTSPGDPCDTCQTCDETGDACTTNTGSCFIAATCYADGADDPTNACRECSSATSQTDWSPVASGAACDDGDACTTGETCDGAAVCTGGTSVCTCDPLADTCEADHGDGDPCNGTLVCTTTTPNVCEVDPATVGAVDDPCDDGLDCNGGDTCQTGTSGLECTHDAVSPCLSCETCTDTSPTGHTCARNSGFCIIAGTCYARGTIHTANPCHVCDDVAPADPTNWSNVSDGTPCDDALYCNGVDTCATGACGHANAPCDPASCFGTCDEGTDTCATAACYIATACYAPGDDNPANPCEECVPATSRAAFSAKPDLSPCDDALFCNGVDTCTTGVCGHAGDPCAPTSCFGACLEASDACTTSACYIGAACYAPGDDNPTNSCQECVPGTSTTAWTNKANGVVCAGDADACTLDTCSAGTCAHTAGCTDSVVELDDHTVRFCVTDAACATAVGAACTEVNVPGEWTTTPWDTTSNAMTACTGYYAFTSPALTPGSHCYKFLGNRTTTNVWFPDPGAGADCGVGPTYCDPSGLNTNCRYTAL
ncbi:MAG: DUF4215 domain-containing protein [Deltaproteobacteria bacterium]|nr:DUF4215 domain-containing protein [Deltaproteobacteria bacterium]